MLLAGLLSYVVLQFAIGVWVSRRTATDTDYILAGRTLGPALVAFSVFATWFGAEAIVATTGEAWRDVGEDGRLVVLTGGEPMLQADNALIDALHVRGIEFDPDDVTYFIGHESIIAGKAPGMHPALEHLFVLLNRGADSASRFFNLPAERVFEVGSRVEI